jgi:hypothetical protein
MRHIATLIVMTGLIAANSSSAAVATRGPKEGLMLESQVTHLGAFVKSRVVLEAGSSEWVKIGEGRAKAAQGSDGDRFVGERFVIEARAVMLDADIAEVETRVRGQKHEETGKLLVRLGDYGEITTSQMESLSGAKKERAVETKLGVRVVKIRVQ